MDRAVASRSKTKGEVRLDDNKIHVFGARRTNVTGLNAREPCAEELAPKSVETDNLGLNKAVIRSLGTVEFPRVLDVLRAKEGRVCGFDSGE